MLKPILALAVLTLSGCAIIQEPPKHGTPDAVYTTKSDAKSVALCIADVFADYDPFIKARYKEEFWGYKINYSADKFIWHAVSRAVGNPKNQGSELIDNIQ